MIATILPCELISSNALCYRVQEINKNKLEVFNHTLNDTNERSGEFKWKVPYSNVDYKVRTFVNDSHNCGGLIAPHVVVIGM